MENTKMKITFFGTTTLLFDDGRDQILFDCHFTRPSLLSYVRGKKCPTNTKLIDELIRVHKIDRLRAIFISHTHHDHVMDMPYVANLTGADVYGTSSALNVARGGGVPEDKLNAFGAPEDAALEIARSFMAGNKAALRLNEPGAPAALPTSAFKVCDFTITVIPSLHSKPTALNNDLGQTIDKPLVQPAGLREYKEGGSLDFLVEAHGKTFLIRPSFNHVKGQLDGISADCLFLGIAGIAKADAKTEAEFFTETAAKVKPRLIIPLHWDNFFSPLDKPVKDMPGFVENTKLAFFKLSRYCEANGIDTITQMPGTSIEI